MPVAELADNFLGFVAGWIEQTNNLAETADSNRFGYDSDTAFCRRSLDSGAPRSC